MTALLPRMRGAPGELTSTATRPASPAATYAVVPLTVTPQALPVILLTTRGRAAARNGAAGLVRSTVHTPAVPTVTTARVPLLLSATPLKAETRLVVKVPR